MMTLLARFQVQPGKEDAFVEILSGLAAEVKNEPGTRRYELHRSVNDPSTFLMYEDYADKAALEAHSATVYFKAAFPQLLALSVGRPEVRRFEQPE
ncbi:MAG: putative quinol monooxygenase [Dehalococcoidia bacterium]|nr:putative quinol monooxygenase [Dehalococcoidia bacterium]